VRTAVCLLDTTGLESSQTFGFAKKYKTLVPKEGGMWGSAFVGEIVDEM
jgi:hypothetical protein